MKNKRDRERRRIMNANIYNYFRNKRTKVLMIWKKLKYCSTISAVVRITYFFSVIKQILKRYRIYSESNKFQQ